MILHGALLGCGHVSQFHLRAWAQIEGVEIVALANRTASKAEARAREFGIPLKHTYSDHRELLEKEDVDFVDIATAPHIHRQQVEAATARGRQVLCQKPFAPTLEDARAMLAACDRVERLTLEGDKGTVELIPGQPAILRVTTARETWQRPAFDVTPEEAYQAS